MSQLFGVGLDIEVKRINNSFKMQIMKKGGKSGIKTLGVIFRQFDNNGNRKLDQQEFTEALAQFGLFPKVVEIQALMKYYDANGDGNISYDEFVSALREPLTDRRLKIVEKVFKMMDKDESGVITVQDIANIYDVSQSQEYKNGLKTREQILVSFLDNFEGLRGRRDGQVTWQEFLDYYTELSMSIPNDNYFIEMMESAWQIGEDEEQGVFKDQVEFLTKTLRQKLIAIGNNKSQDEYVLRQLFKDFDSNQSGTLTCDELTNMLAKLQIAVDRKYVMALFKKFDANQSGTIEFEEFQDFVIRNPYK